MSFGKLYWYPKAPRATMCLYIAELNKYVVAIACMFIKFLTPHEGSMSSTSKRGLSKSTLARGV